MQYQIQIDKTLSHLNSSVVNLLSRKKLLIKLKETILQNQGQIEEALLADLKKGQFESYVSEIGFVVQEIDHALIKLSSWAKPKKVPTPLVHWPARSYITSVPYGKVLIIGPWNYPFQLVFSPLVGAIAAGNTAILKPSELAPATASIIKKITEQAFAATEIVTILGGVEETSYLLDQKFDKIFYTGSTRVGRIVMEKAARYLTPVTLELGGKSPCVILDDADVALAAKRIVWGKFFNAGQTCVAPDYLLVQDNIYLKLIEQIKYFLEDFYGKDPLKNSDYGKIINRNHFNRLCSYLKKEEIIHGGSHDDEKLILAPTLVNATNMNSEIMNDEIFGPILPIVKVSNLDTAIGFINSRPRPLALYLFSNNHQNQQTILNKTVSGGVCLNDTLVHMSTEYMPFGGVGESGMGAYHGKFSFDIFSHKRAVMKRYFFLDLPLRYPPYNNKLKYIKMIFYWIGKFKSIFN